MCLIKVSAAGRAPRGPRARAVGRARSQRAPGVRKHGATTRTGMNEPPPRYKHTATNAKEDLFSFLFLSLGKGSLGIDHLSPSFLFFNLIFSQTNTWALSMNEGRVATLLCLHFQERLI